MIKFVSSVSIKINFFLKVLTAKMQKYLAFAIAALVGVQAVKLQSAAEQLGALGDVTSSVMVASGVDEDLANSVGGSVGAAGDVADQAIAGTDPSEIDYSDLTSSTIDATGQAVATVDPEAGAAISATSDSAGQVVQSSVEGDATGAATAAAQGASEGYTTYTGNEPVVASGSTTATTVDGSTAAAPPAEPAPAPAAEPAPTQTIIVTNTVDQNGNVVSSTATTA